MIRKETLKTIIADSQSRAFPVTWKRSLDIPTSVDKIISLTGARRSGKTYLLYHQMDKLLRQGIPRERIVYINFEDERIPFSADELDLILQSYRELHPSVDLSECYFFFDEIQEAPLWEKFVARIYESISKHIYLTGSNSTLLSREIATSLRGRTLNYEVYPLSFRELLSIFYPSLKQAKSADQAKIRALFQKFIYHGGFPEIVQQEEALRVKILQEYFNVMMLRDLIERYQISQTAALKYFCKRLISSSAGDFSVYKVYLELKSQGYKVSKDTLYEFQVYAEAIYLNRLLDKFDESFVKAELSRKKTYVIDQGLGTAMDFKFAQDRGRLLENTVGLELIKYGKYLAYAIQDSAECDFVVKDKNQIMEAIQVAVHLDDQRTRNREVKGLVNTCKRYHLDRGTILCMDHEEEFAVEGIAIQVLPAWRYVLNL
ncbi:MAG TPA: ATP-binding protein [Caldisericia bacterium]|nr:ATP-binding protein [Caldisericia bacterium]